jgi:hypothetical protein
MLANSQLQMAHFATGVQSPPLTLSSLITCLDSHSTNNKEQQQQQKQQEVLTTHPKTVNTSCTTPGREVRQRKRSC